MLSLIIIITIIFGVITWSRRRSTPPAPAQDLGQPPNRWYGPTVLTGHIRELSVQANSEVIAMMGPADKPRLEQTYLQVGDVLAAMRYYRTAVSPAYSDRLIGDGLGDPAKFISMYIERYETLPASPDTAQALEILRHLHSSQSAGVIVALVRMVIDKLEARGY